MARTYVAATGWLAGCEECGVMPDEFEARTEAVDWASNHICGAPDTLRESLRRAYLGTRQGEYLG